MPSYNKVVLVGNLTRDPELKFTPTGLAIAKVGLAVNRKWRTETGETKEEVLFVDVSVFGKTAEALAQYMKKGGAIMVDGRLKMDQWEDKNTHEKRSKLGVVAEGVQFLNGKRSEAAPSPEAAAGAPSGGHKPETEDDVPF